MLRGKGILSYWLVWVIGGDILSSYFDSVNRRYEYFVRKAGPCDRQREQASYGE